MPTSTIALDGVDITVVPLPTCPPPKMVEPWVSDSVALIQFPFTGQTQAQASSGADLWGMMVTYAPLTVAQAGPLLAWLMQMRGMERAVQMAPPEYQGPQGDPGGTPITVGTTVAGSTSLSTQGWTANAYGLLLPFDCIQIGQRLYRVLDSVNSDANGDATFEIWPSLREDVLQDNPIITDNPLGLFRLATNKRNWSTDYTRLTHLSFPLVEYR
jgi:hypothetical protein